MTGPPARETAAQRVERIKRERAPWSIMDDIRRYAREGFHSIPEADLTVRFRAWGLYTQGDGNGTRGDAVPFFMMRVRTPNGDLTSQMVHTIADLADRYARSTIDITNRQNFQLHWLRIEDIPTVWDALAEVGWTSQGACGDNTRTVTGCPLAGVDADEVTDASALAIAVDRTLNGNPEFANLPRKFKITVTGCRHWCTYPEINDIGITAVKRGSELGYHVQVGGGLSTRPHMALRLNAFVPPEHVAHVAKTIAAIFRDSDELRVNRTKARMKFLFVNHGWTAESFLQEIQRRLGHRFDAAAHDDIPDGRIRDHVGVQPQKQPGLSYAGFSVVSGRITPPQLRGIADLASRYGNGKLRTTAMQNLVALNIRDEDIATLIHESSALGVPLTGSAFQRGTLSCTGSEFCKLAITETKRFSIRLAAEMEQRVPGLNERIRVYVTGCPNACGQHWIADIGLQGVRLTENGEQVEGFDVFVGGGVGARASFARRVGFRTRADEIPAALERLCRAFTAGSSTGESFHAWVGRLADTDVKTLLAGT
ncbi:MAG: nitrite/sulfite reductase [Gemmatimonadaceae bacterium]